MGLTMKEKQAITKQLALRYKRVDKKEKAQILDWLIQLTDYNRSYAARLLRPRVKPKVLGRGKVGGVYITLVEDERGRRKKKPKRRPRKYDKAVFIALRKIWVICDCICGKRLAPYLSEIVPMNKQYQLRARSNTKPGALLKHQIPIRTFSEWNEEQPGFVEVDLVSHEGGDSRGIFIQRLDLADVCTGWTEIRAVKNKAQVWIFAALK
jgi:hypothetical protein